MVHATNIQSGVTLIQAVTTLEGSDLTPLRRLLEDLEDAQEPRVILDFSKTTHLHYRAADLLALHSHLCSRSDRRLILAGLNRTLTHILALSTRYDALDIAASPEEALAWVTGGEASLHVH